MTVAVISAGDITVGDADGIPVIPPPTQRPPPKGFSQVIAKKRTSANRSSPPPPADRDRPSMRNPLTRAARLRYLRSWTIISPVITDSSPVKGLVSAWSKEAKLGRLINACAETVTQKPSFRTAARETPLRAPSRRVLRMAGHPGRKQPYFLHDDKVLNMARLYELWRDPAKDNDDPTRCLWTATVLTTTVILGRPRRYGRRPGDLLVGRCPRRPR